MSVASRREFLRIVGGTCLTAAIAPNYSFGAGQSLTADVDGILVEGASFADKGGWKLDTQHYQQMGGCYLLAHGLGKPVANARATAVIPEAKTWYVFVRTRNWCPGDWEAPGRFLVKVNGKRLQPEFGTEPGWAWQSGGEVTLPAGEATIELEDLTGFDGRCDAIYLSRTPAPKLPGTDLVELSNWKDQLTGRNKLKVESFDYDVVIVGGGMSGCGAALAARSQGLKVALIQDRPVFGGNASEEIRVHTLGIHGKGEKILKQIDTKHYPNGSAEAIPDQKKREASMAASGVDLYAHHLCCGLEKDGKRINSVEAREVTTGIIKRFKAPVFIDATGDGWLGFWAGAEFRYGREAHTEFDEQWKQHGDFWSPEKPDNRVMGTSVLWYSEKKEAPSTFPKVPWAMPVAKKSSELAGEWHWEYSNNDLNQIDDAEAIRDHMLRAIYGSFANAKQQPKNALFALGFVAYIGGKRESRRLVGDHIYSMHDATERREFEDAVVEETREVDNHYQMALQGHPSDFLSKALFHKTGGKYYIPFRSFYSKNLDNLMMAGRCFSCTHIGLCGPRVMNTCGQMGIAVGYAATLCKKHSATPREVGKTHIKELRKLIGYA